RLDGASLFRLACPISTVPVTSRNFSMTTALKFLERILPEDGYKCATVFNEGKVFNKFFATVPELAKFISQQDGLDRTVYHACAAFGTPDSRRASNAIGARAFWLDVDCGWDDKKKEWRKYKTA